MSALRALFILAIGTIFVLVGIASFNYSVDAQCYYRCTDVAKDKKTVNSYYQMVQRLLTFPDTKIVIVGSSRGETMSALWVQKNTGLRTLNLSAAGAEFFTKKAFLKAATETNKIKKVIWLADYFELIPETQDVKIKKTPALRRYLETEKSKTNVWFEKISFLQSLIDHNTTSASLHLLKRPPATTLDQGGLIDLDGKCESESYQGKETQASLESEINVLFEVYTKKILRPPQSAKIWDSFESEINELKKQKIDVIIMVIPYHPIFLQRLKEQHPQLYNNHQAWAKRIEGLRQDGVQVLNYLDGFEVDEATPKYWNDGVHFTCYSAIKMLQKAQFTHEL